MDCPHIIDNVGLGKESIRAVKNSNIATLPVSTVVAAEPLTTTPTTVGDPLDAANVSDAVALSDVVIAASPATVLTVATTASSSPTAAAASSKHWKCTGNELRLPQ
uniref:Uncharacterized protein n=1 Tax=Anopheles maculatus TaxID=74869 RepID=A0A182SVZ1_9DIPT